MSGAETTLWARIFADELARHGVSQVVLAPGSRSTPLVMAFAADGRFRLRVHLDERSAAFFALGAGKATGVPTAVVTTSGTAVANLFPAVVEASMAAVPLLLLTADRPHRLRDADANQAIDQQHMFGRYVRRYIESAPPTSDEGALRHLRTLVARAVADARGPTAGPVHVNFPFDKPLEPVHVPEVEAGAGRLGARGREDGAPFVRVGRGRRGADAAESDALADLLDTPRGVIVAGPSSEPDRTGPAVLAFAAATGFPLLADPLSGARFGPSDGAHRVGAYDLFLADPSVADRLAPEIVLRVGSSPTSATAERWLARHQDALHVVVDGESRWKDHLAVAAHYLQADTADTMRALAGRVAAPRVERAWSDAWRAVEGAALAAVATDEGPAHEGSILAAVAAAMPDGSTLVVSSSMPVRDLDAFAHPREERLKVLGNRGASGIDGVVSTAFGVASGQAEPVACVIGDVAFFHDQNGLLWSREPDLPVVFVLIDNDGGAIFHMLPIAGHEPHFTPYFATPHGLDLAGAAELHGIPVWESSARDVARRLREALDGGRCTVIRVRTDRGSNQARHLEVKKAVSEAAAEAVASLEPVSNSIDSDPPTRNR